MRKRNVHIQFWLDKKEAETLHKRVKKSGLSREAYLRHLVNGLEPQDAPPPDYYACLLYTSRFQQLDVLQKLCIVHFKFLNRLERKQLFLRQRGTRKDGRSI